jgi:SAM-dependent methyltransferase
VVDLGCGALNPYGIGFLFLMLGARRAIVVDLDPIHDPGQAIRALADCAAMMLVDPAQLVGDRAIARADVLRNLEGFDLRLLRDSDPAGIDPERLLYLQESVTALSIEDGGADLVMSNALLEHVSDADAAAAELARITRNGGCHIHNIDGVDHRRYQRPDCHPLAFLAENSTEALVHGSNRIRPHEFAAIFGRHGFAEIGFHPWETVEIDATLHQRFVPRFRSMKPEELQVVGATLYLRRSGTGLY